MTTRFETFGLLRRSAVLSLAALTLAGTASAQTPAAAKPPATTAANARPVPNYVIVQAEHPDDSSTVQVATAQCPQGLRVMGAGFSAVIRSAPGKDPAAGAAQKPAYHEEGLENVRSFPNTLGTGWQVSGVAPGALATKQPWHLVVRAVCLRVAP